MRMSRLVNAIEQSIHFNISEHFLMVEGDWYMIRETHVFKMEGMGMNSLVYHKGCSGAAQPFMHWKKLTCQGCGKKAPDKIAGAWLLHNFDEIAEINHAN